MLDMHADIIDVRDIIASIEQLETARETSAFSADDSAELQALLGLLGELKGAGGDEQWRGDWYPDTLIAESAMEDYARDMAEDCGLIPANLAWPTMHIDWKAATRDFATDYTAIDIDGTTYYYR